MPNKPKTRRRRSRDKNFVAIPVTGSVSIGALASTEVISGNVFSAALKEDLFVISADISGQIVSLTAGEGDPADVGVAHDDYSVTEIAEKLNVSLLGPGDKIEQEASRRLVRRIGTLLQTEAAATVMRLFGRFGSANIRTKIGFTIQSGHNLKMYVHNRSGAAFTTGAILRYSGTLYGKWLL